MDHVASLDGEDGGGRGAVVMVDHGLIFKQFDEFGNAWGEKLQSGVKTVARDDSRHSLFSSLVDISMLCAGSG